MRDNPASMLEEWRGETELPTIMETDYSDPDETTQSLITINWRLRHESKSHQPVS